eukprot:5367486-Amphidinium_carterae.1
MTAALGWLGIVGLVEVREVFDLMDMDGSGEVGVDEFVQGSSRAVLQKLYGCVTEEFIHLLYSIGSLWAVSFDIG